MNTRLETLQKKAAAAQAELAQVQEEARRQQEAADQAAALQKRNYRYALEALADNYLDADYLEEQNSAPLGSTFRGRSVTDATIGKLKTLDQRIVEEVASAVKAEKDPIPVWIRYASTYKQLMRLDAFHLGIILNNVNLEVQGLHLKDGRSPLYNRWQEITQKYGPNSPEMEALRQEAKALIEERNGNTTELMEHGQGYGEGVLIGGESWRDFTARLDQYVAVDSHWQSGFSLGKLKPKPYTQVLDAALVLVADNASDDVVNAHIEDMRQQAQALADSGQEVPASKRVAGRKYRA